MKKVYLIILVLSSITTVVDAQYTSGKTLTLAGAPSGGIQEARDWVEMGPGDYQYSPYAFEARINESLLYDVVSQEPVNPDTRDLNLLLPVGATAGNLSIQPTGAATYQVPIFVSPGTAGVQPNISVVYNSFGGNGILGFGNNLAGISAITRVPKNIYNDSESGAVSLNLNDRYALDGNRMVLVSGEYGQAGSTYRTEIESFVKATAYNTAGNGPSYFIVQTKDGSVLEYGNSVSSKVEAYGNTTVLMWRINKATDANGNFIEYSYGEVNGESYITQIKYTGNSNTGLLPYNEVNFYYETRSDIRKLYVAGSQVLQTLLLRKIGVKCEGEVIREYEFKYSFNSITRLNEIIEFGKNRDRLNSTILSWGTRTPTLQTTVLPNPGMNEHFIGTGDFNGDGQTDYAAYWGNSWQIYTAKPNGIEFLGYSGQTLNSEYQILGYYIADVDGDLMDDLIIKFKKNADDNVTNYIFRISSQGGYSHMDDTIKYISNEQMLLTGDFTGDGICDLLIADYGTDDWFMYSYSYSGGSLNHLSLINNGTGVPWLFNTSYFEIRRIPININGNGKNDILIVGHQGYNIYEYNGNNFVSIASGNDFTTFDFYTWGDFNGDRLTDIYVRTDSGGKIKYSKGTGFIDVTCNVFDSFNFTVSSLYTQEINGDGLIDLVVIGKGAGSSNKIFISLSNGINFNAYVAYTPPITLGFNDYYNQFGDFNGDGNIEYLYTDNSIQRLFNIYSGKADLLLQSITNGMNSKTSIAYRTMTDDADGFFNKGGTGLFPLAIIQASQYLVSSITYNNGVGSTNNIEYKYNTARFHMQGKGFLGITIFTEYNNGTGIKSQSNFFHNGTYYNSFLTYSEKRTINDNSLISSITNTNNIIVLDYAKKRIFPYIQQVVALDNLTITTTTATYTYDSDGNQRNVITNYGNDVTTVVQNSFNLYAGWGPKNKLTRSNVIKTYNGQPSYTRLEKFSYDTRGNLTQTLADSGKVKAVTQNFIINSYGLVTYTIISAADIVSRTSYFYYDTKYRLTKSEKNPLNHTENYEYDYGLGLVTSKTDANLNTTQYTYDNFGRLVTAKLPTSKIINSTYGWVTNNIPTNARYYTSSNSYGSPETKIYYDILGRELRNSANGFDGTLVYNDKEYYTDGNIKREKGPYQFGDNEIWTNFYYDNFKRVSNIITPTCSLNYSYSGKTLTVTDCKGRGVSQTINNAGDVISANDKGVMILYDYHSSGQVRKTNAAGSVDSMFYDEYGRQWKLRDPDAGIFTYSYNSLGELISQTNPKGQQTTLTYDKLGRVLSKNSPEGITTYTYDNAAYGKGMVSLISSSNNTVAYTYDEYSRLSSVTNTIDGTGYATSYVYDNNNGKPSQVTYPSQFGIINEYNSYGYLTRVKRSDNQSLIWECTGVNGYGQVTEAILGNSLNVSREYNQYGFPTYIQTGNVQNMQFHFNDTTGNLEWRKDNLSGRGFIDYFTYDIHDRLTNCKIGSNNYSVSYHNNGNILTKHDAGTYAYGTRPHAIAGLTNSPITDPAQRITYNSYEQPDTIEQGSKRLVISYGVDEQRIKSVYTENSLGWTRRYNGNYEEVVINQTVMKKIHYIPGGDGLAAIYIIDVTGTGYMYYVSKDYLGNILLLTKQDGTVAEEYSYDAWGRRRSPINWINYSVSAPTISYRGYTGHEHLDDFNLINMNGRCYDPVIGRFLSPDNFVQDPLSAQSYNRYSYCLNNPLKYSDPTGEKTWSGKFFDWINERDPIFRAFIVLPTALSLAPNTLTTLDLATNGATFINFIRGGFDESGQAVKNSIEITVQLFDPGTEKAGWGWDLLSRFTYEGLNTSVGYLVSNLTNTFFNVNDIQFYRGTTVLQTGGEWGAITFGNYIIGDNDIKADPANPLFQHEFGHYLQSKISGPGYFFEYGIPSLVDAAGTGDHNYFWAELDANRTAFNYFDTHYSDYIGWDIYQNPLFEQGDVRNNHYPKFYRGRRKD